MQMLQADHGQNSSPASAACSKSLLLMITERLQSRVLIVPWLLSTAVHSKQAGMSSPQHTKEMF
jgi:hypothetical protein